MLERYYTMFQSYLKLIATHFDLFNNRLHIGFFWSFLNET